MHHSSKGSVIQSNLSIFFKSKKESRFADPTFPDNYKVKLIIWKICKLVNPANLSIFNDQNWTISSFYESNQTKPNQTIPKPRLTGPLMTHAYTTPKPTARRICEEEKWWSLQSPVSWKPPTPNYPSSKIMGNATIFFLIKYRSKS